MRWFLAALAVCAVVLAPAGVRAGDYHSGTALICSDCHTAHYSQQHVYNTGDDPLSVVPLGPNGPYPSLLRNEENALCLTCHNGKAWAPDVFGANTIATVREAGALNSASPSALANDANYDNIDGHSLYSTATAPGGTFSDASGLQCTDCHEQHGQNAGQYRNLKLGRAPNQTPLTYNKGAAGTVDLTKDVFEHNAPPAVVNFAANVTGYTVDDVDFCEPNTHGSAYATWCQQCHTHFHGTAGSADMGGAAGGDANHAFPWLRHPQADVNIGQNASYISSLTQYSSHTNKVKVMDPTGTWGAVANAGVTPSCFSCHKAHGNQNGFGLIYMAGTGTVTEEGDGGVYKDLCRQCHVQGG